MNLHTEEQVAAKFGLTVEKAAELRRKQGWPHVRLSRFDVRYTDAQLEQIVAARSVSGERSLSVDTGLTKRSARRSA